MKTGVTYNSRRSSNFIKHLNPEKREEHLKRFIASCNVEQLMPFIKIIKHDKNYREVEYVIDIPKQ